MILSYLHFFACITYAYLAIYVLVKNPRELLNRICASIFVCLVIWSLHYVFRNAPGNTAETALVAVDFGAVGWIGLAPAVLWFNLLLTGHRALLRRRWLVAVTVIPVVILFAAQWQNKIIQDVSFQAHGWGGVWSFSVWTAVFLIYFCICLLVSVGVLFRFVRTTQSVSKKHQGQWLLISTLLVFCFGMVTDVVLPMAGVEEMPPVADLLMMIWAAGLTYVIVRYKLMAISPATAAENIIATMSDLLILTDTRLHIMRVNAATLECLNYAREEIEGLDFGRLICAGDNAGKTFYQNMINSKVQNMQMCLRTSKGQDVPVMISNSPLMDQDGDHVGLVVVAKDIREQKRAEDERQMLQAQLIKSQRLEAIGTLAGGVAHDLNNILGGIVSYPDLLLHDMPDDDPMFRPLLSIKKSGQKAAAIVEDLLAMARRGVRNTKVLDLKDSVKEFLNSPEYLHMIGLYPQAKVSTRSSTDLWRVKASVFHISKVLMNLVGNALEALTASGDIGIHIENRQLAAPIHGYETVPPGRFVALSVSDSGMGIAPGDLEHIFEPFYTKKVMGRSGTGLGMAVVWGAVKDHGGYIDLESRVSEGTRVTLYLPAVEPSEEDAPVAEDQQPIEKGHREAILVVDDMDDQRKLASSILTSLGYCVSTAKGGEEAVELLQEHAFDLVLLDMIMDPGIDGLETFRRVKQFRPDQRAVIASGYAGSERVKSALSLGVHCFVQKPYSLQRIAAAVRTALEVSDPTR